MQLQVPILSCLLLTRDARICTLLLPPLEDLVLPLEPSPGDMMAAPSAPAAERVLDVTSLQAVHSLVDVAAQEGLTAEGGWTGLSVKFCPALQLVVSGTAVQSVDVCILM